MDFLPTEDELDSSTRLWGVLFFVAGIVAVLALAAGIGALIGSFL
jgi:hypothetical protein